MADMTRFITFTVEQKNEGKYLRNRLLMIAAYVAFCVGILALAVAIAKGLGVLIGVILVGVLLLKVLKPLTWKYVQTEHRYTIQSGEWKLFRDHTPSLQALDPFYKRKIKEAETIVPMTEENLDKYVKGNTFAKEFDMRGNTKAADAYIAIFPEEDGSKTLIKFVATNDALGIMKYYNAEATEVTSVYH